MEEEKEEQESNAEDKLESNEIDAEDTPEEISLEDKVKELEDKILRSAAEVENIRKRSEKERAEAYKIGISLKQMILRYKKHAWVVQIHISSMLIFYRKSCTVSMNSFK